MALLVPGLCAGAIVPLTFTAASLMAAGGTVLEGRLAAVEAFTPEGEPVPGWTLRLAGDGRFDLETETRWVVNGVVVNDIAVQAPMQPDRHESVQATGTWHGRPRMDDSYVFVRDLPGHPAPSITLDPLSTRLTAPADECVQANPKWSNMSVPDCRAVRAATAGLDGRGRVEVRIQGAFQVVVWGWALENDTHTLTTGRVQGRPVQDHSEPRIHEMNKTAAVGEFPAGELVLDVEASGLRHLFIEGLAVRTDGVILAQDARDLLTQESHGNLQMEGATTLAVRPEQERLAVAVVQHGQVGVVAPPPPPKAASAAAPAPVGGADAPWPAVAASAMLLSLVAGGLLWRRRAAAAEPLSRVTRALDKGRHDQAMAAAASSGLPLGSRRVLEAIAMIKAGRLDEAERVVKDPASGLDDAARHYLLAAVAASRGEDAAARRHLQECFRHDPAYRLEAAMNRQLRRLLGAEGAGSGAGSAGASGSAAGAAGPDAAGGREAYA